VKRLGYGLLNTAAELELQIPPIIETHDNVNIDSIDGGTISTNSDFTTLSSDTIETWCMKIDSLLLKSNDENFVRVLIVLMRAQKEKLIIGMSVCSISVLLSSNQSATDAKG